MSKPKLPISHSSKAPQFISRRLDRHPFVLPVATFLVLFFVSAAAIINMNARTVGASDTRIVRVTLDGTEQTLPTRASTVGELLGRLGVQVRPEDAVHPSLDTEILEDNLEIHYRRAEPVTILDEGRKITTLSAAEQPQEVADSAGIPVYPEDKVQVDNGTEVARDGIIGQKIVIKRAKPTSINLYGTPITVRTHARTVGEVLAEKDIKTNDGDTVQPTPDTPLTQNTQIFIVSVGKQLETKEEVIAPPLETIDDPTMASGTTTVKEAGSPGKKVVTYETELRNKKPTNRKVLQEVITVQPVKKVVIRGSKVVYSNPSANVELGRQIAEQMGYGSQFSCIYSIFQRESRWNHTARNKSSGAYGIPQALPGSKMGPGWESDPAVQIRWGINYMVNRYGSPCGAQRFWEIHHWY